MREVFDKIIEQLGNKIFSAELYGNEWNGQTVGNLLCLGDVRDVIEQAESEYNGGWIPCSERLPDDYDNRFYMCIVENHEEDLPMFCQYEEEYGFGFWNDIYDKYSLGFVDTEFEPIEESGYEKVIAWQQMPELYHPRGE